MFVLGYRFLHNDSGAPGRRPAARGEAGDTRSNTSTNRQPGRRCLGKISFFIYGVVTVSITKL